MAPVNQLGVLVFASAVLAVPHAHHHLGKRHAHPSHAPPAYESSYVPVYGAPSSSAAPVSSSVQAPVYGGSSSSAAPVSKSSSYSAPVYGGSSSSAAAVSGSSSYYAPVYGGSSSSYSASSASSYYGSSSSSYSASAVSSSASAYPTPSCWSDCFEKAGIKGESELCGNDEVSKCIHDTCSEEEDKAYWGWYESYCPAGSSSSAYASATHSKFVFPTGGYGYGSSSSVNVYPTGTGYPSGYPTGSPSYSVCTETSTMIYRSTTEYSTYYVTHTVYESPSASASPSSVAPASEGGYGNGGYGNGGWGSSPAAPGYSSPASAPAGGATCAPDVTVTETQKTTVYVTAGAPSSEAAPSYGGGWGSTPSAPESTPSSYAAPSSPAAPSYPAAPSSPAAPSYPAPSSPAAPTSEAAPSYPAAPTSEAAPSYPAAGSSSPAAPSSAPAPTYSSPPSNGGGQKGKRGLCYNDANLAKVWANGAAGGWAYNWESDSKGLDSSIPYIPMLWGLDNMWTSIWAENAKKGIANGAEYLFSFNEPDMSTQANLSPEAAAEGWKQYMEQFAGQAKLVSPSVTNGQSPGVGLDWLNQFMSACSDCSIDSVAMHWYYTGNPVDEFKNQITAVHEATGKNIWLNEFGASGSDEEKSAFLKEVLPWLDSCEWINGYSYYMVSDGLLMIGDAPSSYGKLYSE